MQFSADFGKKEANLNLRPDIECESDLGQVSVIEPATPTRH